MGKYGIFLLHVLLGILMYLFFVVTNGIIENSYSNKKEIYFSGYLDTSNNSSCKSYWIIKETIDKGNCNNLLNRHLDIDTREYLETSITGYEQRILLDLKESKVKDLCIFESSTSRHTELYKFNLIDELSYAKNNCERSFRYNLDGYIKSLEFKQEQLNISKLIKE